MEDLQGEIWKPAIYNGIDYSGYYEVSNMGRVKQKDGKIMKGGHDGRKRYKMICFCVNRKIKSTLIHRLVANTFLGKIDVGFVVDHINSNSLDNRLCNLRIISKRENESKERTTRTGMPVGVSTEKGRWIISLITINYKKLRLGSYKTIETASNAYKIALNTHEQGKDISDIFKAVEKYRESINLKPIKRKITTSKTHK